MDWIKTKPPTIKGNIIIQRSDKLLTINSPETAALLTLNPKPNAILKLTNY